MDLDVRSTWSPAPAAGVAMVALAVLAGCAETGVTTPRSSGEEPVLVEPVAQRLAEGSNLWSGERRRMMDPASRVLDLADRVELTDEQIERLEEVRAHHFQDLEARLEELRVSAPERLRLREEGGAGVLRDPVLRDRRWALRERQEAGRGGDVFRDEEGALRDGRGGALRDGLRLRLEGRGQGAPRIGPKRRAPDGEVRSLRRRLDLGELRSEVEDILTPEQRVTLRSLQEEVRRDLGVRFEEMRSRRERMRTRIGEGRSRREAGRRGPARR